jgi:alkylhydroperoxidase family enzyme
VKVTREAHRVAAGDIDALRAEGLSDAAVHDVVQIAALFNYYNRLVDALGVEPEDFMRAGAGSD